MSESTESKPAFHPGLVQMAIRSGILDDQLDDVIRWVQQRRELKAIEVVSALQVGDEITLSDHISPKLLAGKRCRVVGFDGDKIEVRLMQHTSSSKWHHGKGFIISRTLVGAKVETQLSLSDD